MYITIQLGTAKDGPKKLKLVSEGHVMIVEVDKRYFHIDPFHFDYSVYIDDICNEIIKLEKAGIFVRPGDLSITVDGLYIKVELTYWIGEQTRPLFFSEADPKHAGELEYTFVSALITNLMVTRLKSIGK